MARVIVLTGGNSDEREIALLSGTAVVKALQAAGHTVTVADPQNGLAEHLPVLQQTDVVFPALHGTYGEDGGVQHFLEEHGIPFVGSDSTASQLCFDKQAYAKLLDTQNILMPRSEIVDSAGFAYSGLAKQPFVLKPNDGGSSIDLFIVRDVNQADKAEIEKAFAKHTTMLLQELVEGVEVTAAVLGNEPLPIVEIIPPEGGEFDYENKYNGKTQELCPPQNVTAEKQHEAQMLAKTIHELTDCRDLSRTDIIITPEEQLCVLETNTIPGLTDESLFPQAAAQAGLPMPQLCDQLVQFALNRSESASA